jgi:hypothetical protein
LKSHWFIFTKKSEKPLVELAQLHYLVALAPAATFQLMRLS